MCDELFVVKSKAKSIPNKEIPKQIGEKVNHKTPLEILPSNTSHIKIVVKKRPVIIPTDIQIQKTVVKKLSKIGRLFTL